MKDLNRDVLSIVTQAVILAQGGIISYANPAAVKLLGEDCTGKKLDRLIGSDMSQIQAANFAASTVMNGKKLFLRSTRRENTRIITMEPFHRDTSMINENFLCSIRAELMMLSMSVELCRQETGRIEGKKLAESFSAVDKYTATSTRLISNMAAVKEILADGLRVQPVIFSLDERCRSIIDSIARFFPDVSIELSGQLPPVAADMRLIERLIVNLISNSVRHGRCSRISIRLSSTSSSHIISVSDDGCGMSAEVLGSVFERYRYNSSLTDMSRGAGFGLTIVRGVAEAHGGTVMLESREGSGTTVTVSIKKNPKSTSMRSAHEDMPKMRDLLNELSDCIDSKVFQEVYLD